MERRLSRVGLERPRRARQTAGAGGLPLPYGRRIVPFEPQVGGAPVRQVGLVLGQVALVALLLASLLKQAQAQLVDPPIQVTPTSEYDVMENEPDIAVSHDRAIVAWWGGITSNVGWGYSLDAGLTW